jgi:hypothetical protein
LLLETDFELLLPPQNDGRGDSGPAADPADSNQLIAAGSQIGVNSQVQTLGTMHVDPGTAFLFRFGGNQSPNHDCQKCDDA